jgi:hypothetical protein
VLFSPTHPFLGFGSDDCSSATSDCNGDLEIEIAGLVALDYKEKKKKRRRFRRQIIFDLLNGPCACLPNFALPIIRYFIYKNK